MLVNSDDAQTNNPEQASIVVSAHTDDEQTDLSSNIFFHLPSSSNSIVDVRFVRQSRKDEFCSTGSPGPTVNLVIHGQFGPKISARSISTTRLDTITSDRSSWSLHRLLWATLFQILTIHHRFQPKVRYQWSLVGNVSFPTIDHRRLEFFWYWGQNISFCIWFAIRSIVWGHRAIDKTFEVEKSIATWNLINYDLL